MSEYKLESDIPIPEFEDPTLNDVVELHLEDTRWTPFKPNQRKCRPNKHSPEIGRCTLCGDVFPCPSGNCGHFDCADPSLVGLDCKGNGTELPEDFSCIDAEPMARVTSEEINLHVNEETSIGFEGIEAEVSEEGSD